MIHFFNRAGSYGRPAGITVSKRHELPSGEFGITEYTWGNVSLWFVDDDHFTADERQFAYNIYGMAQNHDPNNG